MSFLLNTTVEYVPYHSVQAIDTMRSMPRFGHSSDFSYLFYLNTGKPKDYISGLLFLGIFTIVCFLVWFLLLAVFKFYFKGVLGGGRSVNSKQSRILCIAFWIATGFSLIFTTLLVTEGISDIQYAISTIDNSNQKISNLALEADSILESLQNVGESSYNIRESLIQNMDNFCPTNSDLQSTIGLDIESEAQTAITWLVKLSDFLQDDLKGMQKVIGSAKEVTKDIDSALTRNAIHDWQAMLIAIPWILIPSAMSIGVLMASCHVSSPFVETLMMWLFLPLLSILTILSVALAAFISSYTVRNADFCYGGSLDTPDESVFKIVNAQGYMNSDIMYQTLIFYIDQCQIPSNNPFSFLEIYHEDIENAEFQLKIFSSSLETVGLDQLTLICGRDFQEIGSLAGQMTVNLSLLKQNALDTLELLRCDNIVPIYTSTIYDGICTSSMQGATWAYCALLVMSLMGMVMITCRSSFLEMDGPDEKVDIEKNQKYQENEDQNEEDEESTRDDEMYSDEDKDRFFSGKERHIVNRNCDWEERSHLQGSYDSNDEDLYTTVGKSKGSFQHFHRRERGGTSYLPSFQSKLSIESLVEACRKKIGK